ncbi:hypothetical protein BAUCODRAFT_143978 [Baudoinia panamericana UAMH 10762]|uniref:Uncharacterized protein n=1 Tax=Baudoinia panamericana (strain UAMH 10762) TaxID=717646 RepID=M2MWQ1_BAUPA|nr:uncharacterized protein BAUCODRAFT_143978 [Baudoinia panamericana UAMH 10762]EMC91009.1 hypothetical protein BAUCODRAFT_143978 [Baudoinia panamericana UAMH 10762]
MEPAEKCLLGVRLAEELEGKVTVLLLGHLRQRLNCDARLIINCSCWKRGDSFQDAFDRWEIDECLDRVAFVPLPSKWLWR